MADANNQVEQLEQALGVDREIVPIHDGNTVKDVVVAPLRLKQFSQVLKCINELADAGISLEGGFDAMKLITSGGDVAIKLMSIASGEPLATIEQLELDEAAQLAGAIYRVNKSFFEKKAETMLAAFGVTPEQAEKLKQSLAGLTSSASSSPTATS